MVIKLEILIKEKKTITLKSLKKIISITPKEANLELSYTNVLIKGENLEISKINEAQSEITICGTIKQLIFDNGKVKQKESFFKKLFE